MLGFFIFNMLVANRIACLLYSVLTKPVLERSLRNMLVMADDRKKAEDAAQAAEAAAATAAVSLS